MLTWKLAIPNSLAIYRILSLATASLTPELATYAVSRVGHSLKNPTRPGPAIEGEGEEDLDRTTEDGLQKIQRSTSSHCELPMLETSSSDGVKVPLPGGRLGIWLSGTDWRDAGTPRRRPRVPRGELGFLLGWPLQTALPS